MQLTDVFCYILLAITISTTSVEAKHEEHDLSETKTEKRISKREAAIFIDGFPIEPIYKHRPKVIYRRISKQRYKSPKSKYGPPNKYRSAKPWKPSKKYRRTVKPKYGPPIYKRHPVKPKYGPSKPISHKPLYGPPKKVHLSSFYPVEPASFGEPPANIDFQTSKHHFGEPPLDSYGEPVSTAVKDPYVPEQFSPPASFADAFVNFEDMGSNFGQDFKSWQTYQSDQNFDNNVAYSKKRPTYAKPESLLTESQDEDFDLNPYSHIYKHREFYTEQEPLPFEKKKTSNYVPKRTATKSWRPRHTTPEPGDEVLVGGHYAEPPERYVPKYAITHYSHDGDFTPLKGYIDPDLAISATTSPYVNYKNSNIAFSPQNLNDAFSIVDK